MGKGRVQVAKSLHSPPLRHNKYSCPWSSYLGEGPGPAGLGASAPTEDGRAAPDERDRGRHSCPRGQNAPLTGLKPLRRGRHTVLQGQGVGQLGLKATARSPR